MPDGIDAFNQSPGVGVQCADCGAHFSLDPAGDISNTACSECNGKRFFRTQPSPVKDDLSGINQLKDMPGAAGSDSPMDTGGNPLQTGIITSKVRPTSRNWFLADLQTPGLDDGEIDQYGLPIRREPGTLAPNSGDNPDLARGVAGFPLSEGTIVGEDGEPSPHADTHGYDGYTHSHVAGYPEGYNGPPDKTCPNCGSPAHWRSGASLGGMYPNGAYECSNQRCWNMMEPDPQESLQHPDPWMDNEPGATTFPEHWAAYPNSRPFPGEMYPDDQMSGHFMGPNGEVSVPKPGSDGGNSPSQIDYTDVTHLPPIPDQPWIPADISNNFGPIHQGNARNQTFNNMTSMNTHGRETLSMDPYPSLWSDEHVSGLLGDVVQGLGDLAPVDQEIPGLDIASDIAKAAPTVMKGVGFAQNMFGGGQQGGMYPNPPITAPTMQQLGSTDIPMLILADLETSDSVKSVDEQHDDPQEQDQKEFDDGDKSPSNLENPNNEDSGASGEDGVRDATPGYGFGPNSPAIQHMQSILPLLLHYITNGLDGKDDPILQDLHQKLDSEQPGYLDKEHPDGPKLMEIIIQKHGPKKQARLATIPLSPYPTPASAVGQDMTPGTDIQPPLGAPQHCPNCGGTVNGDRTCAQCGYPAAGTGLPNNQPQQVTANHQGPVTPEQFEACAQWLQENGKQELTQQLYEHPENFGWLVNEIQQNPQPTAPLVDPGQAQPAPPPSMDQAPGTMPVMDPSQPGGGGGQPMQPMSYKKADANNMVPRCPKCDSATTSMVDTVDGDSGEKSGQCHSCGNIWDLGDGKMNEKKPKAAFVALANPLLDPQAIWSDTNGRPIQEGDQYSLYTAGVPVPDDVTVLSKKPGELQLQLAGTSADFRIKAQDLQNGKYSFEPATNSAADNTAVPQGGHPLDNANVIPEPTTDQVTDMYPNGGGTTSHVNEEDDDHCRKCGSIDTYSIMSSPTTIMHECYHCSSVWETQDNSEYGSADPRRDWLMSSSEDFASERERFIARDTTGSSRNLHDVAAKDPRLSEIRDRLDANASIREAGKHFTQSEKRALIDEHGHARNYDQLDLSQTHYRVDDEYISRRKGNGLDVDDAHLIFGI